MIIAPLHSFDHIIPFIPKDTCKNVITNELGSGIPGIQSITGWIFQSGVTLNFESVEK